MAKQAIKKVMWVMGMYCATAHGRHFVAMHCMNDATSAKEQEGLEHGVCKQVEH